MTRMPQLSTVVRDSAPPADVESGPRIPELDGLRGVAILLVLSWHFLDGLLAGAPLLVRHLAASANRFSFSGVDLFFVLSGFLIGGILLDHRRSAHYFRAFYLRRFFRIVPIYGVLIALFVVLRHSARSAKLQWLFDEALPIWPYLTMTQNFAMARAGTFGAQWLGPTWSLAVEEQFYLVLPFLIRFVPRRVVWLPLALLAAAAPLIRAQLAATVQHGWMSAYTMMPARADALMLGVLAALALRNARLRTLAERHRRALYAAAAWWLVLLGILTLRHATIVTPAMVQYGFSILALFFVTVLAIAVTAPATEAVSRLLRWRALRRTGTLAYGIYLFHLPVAGVTGIFITSAPAGVVVAVAATFLIAQLSWTWFERPLVLRGHRHPYDAEIRYHRTAKWGE